MEIQNTKNLKNFIIGREMSNEKEKNIQQTIESFSEYLVAVNPNYSYNKTYLSAYIEEFIECQRVLRLKHSILSDKILNRISADGIEQECIVIIDGAWKFEKGKVILNNKFDPCVVKKSKMQLELEFIHKNGFVIAEEICIDGNYDDSIDKCITKFIEQRKEILNNEAKQIKYIQKIV